jgi:hypothetical protein
MVPSYMVVDSIPNIGLDVNLIVRQE